MLRGVLLGGAVVLGLGCASAKDDSQAEEANFSVLPANRLTSILPAIEEAEGQPDVCVGLIGYSEAERPAIFARLTSQITDAANQWNRLLEGNALWRLRQSILPNYTMQPFECTETNPAGFAVNLWKGVDRFKSEFCSRNGLEGRCASAAFFRRRIFYLGPFNRTREVEPLDGFTALHEYGHLLGLGDTYRIAGLNDFVGEQPPSVMNGESFSLTEDDKLGLWATLRAVKTGNRSCDGFANQAFFTSNGFNAVLCNPKAEPVIGHDGRPDDVDVPQPPSGPIPDSTLRETNDYQVASIQLNCRSGPGTENPVIVKLVRGTPLTATQGDFIEPRIGLSTEGRPWLRVSVQGTTCYASASLQFITPIGVIPLTTLREVNNYAVSTQLLNCRSGAGTENPVIQTLPLGTKVVSDRGSASQQRIAFTTDGNPWILVRANNQLCYASGNFKFIVPQP